MTRLRSTSQAVRLYGAGLASSACYGMLFFVVHASVGKVAATEIVFLRACVGFLVLLPSAAHELSRIFSRTSGLLWVRSIAVEASTICFTWNLQHTSVGLANVIYNLAPLLVLTAVWITGQEKPSLGRLFDLVLIFSAGAIFWSATAAQRGVPAAVWMVGLLGAAFAAGSQLLLKREAARWRPEILAWSMNAVGLPATLLMRREAWTWVTRETLLPIALVCLLSILAQMLVAVSFRRLEGSTASALVPSSIIWATLLEAAGGGFPPPQAILGSTVYTLGMTRMILYSSATSSKEVPLSTDK